MILQGRIYFVESEIISLSEYDTDETQMVRVKQITNSVSTYVDKRRLAQLIFLEEDSRAKDRI